jgi:hypothetical protein
MKQLGGGEIVFLRPSKLTKGQVIEGVYRGKKKDQFERYGYTLDTPTGRIVVNTGGNLDYLMEHAPEGHTIRIVYKGMKKITKGKNVGKDAHTFEAFDLTANEEAAAPSEAPVAKASGDDSEGGLF